MIKRGQALTKAQNTEFVLPLNNPIRILTLVVLDRGGGNGWVFRGGRSRFQVLLLVSSQPTPSLVVIALLQRGQIRREEPGQGEGLISRPRGRGRVERGLDERLLPPVQETRGRVIVCVLEGERDGELGGGLGTLLDGHHVTWT